MTPAEKAAAALHKWPDLNNAQCQHPIDAEQSDRDALRGFIKAELGRLPKMRTEAGRKRVDAIRDYLTDQLFDLGGVE